MWLSSGLSGVDNCYFRHIVTSYPKMEHVDTPIRWVRLKIDYSEIFFREKP